ncbi:MAG: T9SS type B sorting domain-containing protein [Flavobacterium sp.]|nr:T9SS type B sorting domain-containing protein [Flavobacterium sp.]
MLDLRSSISWTWWNDYNAWGNNPNLKCINVPDAYFFGYYWNGRKDPTASYIDDIPPKFESSTQTICSKVNPTIQDIVVSGYNIKWFDSQVNGNELPSSTILNEGATYFAMNTAGSCEGPRSSVTITLKILSAPAATSPQILCNIQNPTLSILNITGDNIKWYRSVTDVNFISNTTPLVNGITYYASQTKNGCESSRTPILITIQNSTKPIVTSPQTFCIQQNATLNNITITGQNIKWYDALTNGNILINSTLLQNGITYYASQTINGCESERTMVLINIQNTPIPSANNSQSFCSTQNATLNDIAITGTSIKWYSATTNGILLPNSTSLQNGMTYFASQTINGCESTNRTPVTISLINTLNATNYAETICDDQNNGYEIVNLSSFNSNLIGSTTETFGYYTLRNAAENQISANQITNYSNYNLTIGEHTFYVRIDSPNSCHQIVELQLTLVSKPIITIPDIVPICENNSIIIDAGSGSDAYLWSNGASTSSITVINPGNFSVTVTNYYGGVSCSSTKVFTVKKSDKPSISLIETKDWTDNDNIISVYLTNSGDFEYSIDGINYQDSNQFSNVPSGEYTVSVRDKNGCGKVDDEVYLLMFPKFFTPNGDGYNDTWKIKFADAEEGLTIKIFDRYGKLIKMLTDVTDGWNGTFNGAELPASDYWFVVTRANGLEYKGHFSLKR